MKANRSQFRMLPLTAAVSLTNHSRPYPNFQVPDANGVNHGWCFTEWTAKSLIEQELVTLKSIRTNNLETKAIYELTDAGHELEEELCLNWTRGPRNFLRTTHVQEFGPKRFWEQDAVEILAGKLICLDCGRRVPCVSVHAAPHSANSFDNQHGPICDHHMNVVLRRRGWPWMRRSA